MCGFGGVVLRSAGTVEERLLARMGRTLGHRGPDGTQTMASDGAGFVHCRLAIIDLSARANQPLSRPDLGAVLAFNGEIYNFRELRAGLERSGSRFDTESDSEVLLAALVRDGPEALRALRGMFALAVWWPGERRLLLARDALGKKPLFYATREDGALVFGSTLQSILDALGRTPSLSGSAIANYLAHTVVPQEEVIYAGVRRVQPGEWIAFHGPDESGRGRFWEPGRTPAWEGTSEELDAEVERTLRAAVRRRLVGDVPVGAFLSAGIDSGTIVALMAAEAGEPILTFTAGTQGDPYDERGAARAVASRYGTRHTEVEVPPLSAESLPRLLYQCGEPFGDASLLPTARVAEATRRHATVVLTGDGGDELFFGYPVFNGVRLAERLRGMAPGGALRALRSLAGDDRSAGFRNKLDALLEYASAPLAQSFRNRMGWSFDARRRLLQNPEREPAEAIYARRLAACEHLPDADALRRTLLGTWLPNDYLVKVDVATMAVALEARSPFLDVDLVDLLLSVPERVAFPGGQRKALLRPIASRLLPESILRRPKSGFGVPVRSWLLGSLRSSYERFVTRPGLAIHEWIRPEAARSAYAELEGGSVRADRVWLLLTLGVWAAVAVEGVLAPEEPLDV